VSRLTVSRNVLAPALPDFVLLDRVTTRTWHGSRKFYVAHAPYSGMTQCYLPSSELTPVPGAEAWHFSPDWCITCFGEGRCTRNTVDTWGKDVGRCGQPSGAGHVCRWHMERDITEDKQFERAA
jgi:hypothetical protein